MKTFTQAMRYATLIAVAFLMTQCGKKAADGAESSTHGGSISMTARQDSTGENALYIACIQEDSLFANYKFAQEVTDKMISKEESLKATLNQKQREFQNEVNEFQRKYENNAFLTQERAEQEATRLQQKEIELNNYVQKETQQLAIEWEKNNNQVKDSIHSFIKEYNADKKYEVIFLKSATLYIDDKYDITPEVVSLLNKRYEAGKK